MRGGTNLKSELGFQKARNGICSLRSVSRVKDCHLRGSVQDQSSWGNDAQRLCGTQTYERTRPQSDLKKFFGPLEDSN